MEKGNAQVVYVDYENISKVLKAGNRVFVDDGLISLIVSAVSKFHSCFSVSPFPSHPSFLFPLSFLFCVCHIYAHVCMCTYVK